MEVWEGKKYTLERSENFDKFMAVLGVGMFTRKIWNNVYPTIRLVRYGDFYILNIKCIFRNTILKFRLGEEFEEETIDDYIVKTVMTMKGNKLIQKVKGKFIPSIIVREFNDSQMIATMMANNIICTRWYKAD